MLRYLFLISLFIIKLSAFESTNIQLLYGKNFTGDSFIYDTTDGKKATLTFEHFRTFEYGDFFMFVDYMDGEKFDNAKYEVYSELSPRLSLSKLTNNDLSLGFIQDFYIATQINIGYDYLAYLGGLGCNLTLPGLNVFALNLYYKDENIGDIQDETYQLTAVYQTKSLYNVHFEGFLDLTEESINTHNQLLYNLYKGFFIGTEWIYYNYSKDSISTKTSSFQAMLKYKF